MIDHASYCSDASAGPHCSCSGHEVGSVSLGIRSLDSCDGSFLHKLKLELWGGVSVVDLCAQFMVHAINCVLDAYVS